MSTKMPDNKLIGDTRSSGADAAARVSTGEQRELASAQPRHADAAKLGPDPSTSETIQQIEVEPDRQDRTEAAQPAAHQPQKPPDAEPGPIVPLPATNAASTERAEIARRIAAFRDLQIKLQQDRESYFDETMAQARELLSGRAKP